MPGTACGMAAHSQLGCRYPAWGRTLSLGESCGVSSPFWSWYPARQCGDSHSPVGLIYFTARKQRLCASLLKIKSCRDLFNSIFQQGFRRRICSTKVLHWEKADHTEQSSSVKSKTSTPMNSCFSLTTCSGTETVLTSFRTHYQSCTMPRNIPMSFCDALSST